jgi:hypothetical protein
MSYEIESYINSTVHRMTENESETYYNFLVYIYPIYKWGIPLTPSTEILAVLKPGPYKELYDTLHEMYWIQTYYMSECDTGEPKAKYMEYLSTDKFKRWIEAWTKMLDGFTINFDKQTMLYLFNILKIVLTSNNENK